jgi:hypothetical protein
VSESTLRARFPPAMAKLFVVGVAGITRMHRSFAKFLGYKWKPTFWMNSSYSIDLDLEVPV